MKMMLLLTVLALCLYTASAQTASSSSSRAVVSSSSVSSSSSPTSSYASTSSSFYSGNEPAYPGCYLCPAITQCPPFPNTTVYPAFSIVATSSASQDAASCNAVTADILIEVTQYAPTNSCLEAIGFLACYGALYQQLDCLHPVSPAWPALCENYTSCLLPAGQAFITQAGLCTNISAFLNRPVSIGGAGISSSSGSLGSGASPTAGMRLDTLLLTVMLNFLLLITASR